MSLFMSADLNIIQQVQKAGTRLCHETICLREKCKTEPETDALFNSTIFNCSALLFFNEKLRMKRLFVCLFVYLFCLFGL